MFARNLMTSPAITCHANESLDVAAGKLWDHDIGILAIVNDEGKLAGVLTDRDICMAAFSQSRVLNELLVNSAMASHVFSVTPDATLADIEQLMATHQIRRIPVIDPAGKPLGIVSLNDLALAGSPKLAPTLAAICEHRPQSQKAA
jgi:CBS domain-containing protein